MTKQQLTARVAELENLAASVLDEDYCDIVVSAVRYALPRHSYMPSLTRDYVWKHWPLLAKKHWCILRAIRTIRYIRACIPAETFRPKNEHTHTTILQRIHNELTRYETAK